MTHILDVKSMVELPLLNLPGISGVGLGLGSPEHAINVYAESQQAASQVPQQIAGFPVKTIISGRFNALSLLQPLQAHTAKWRPAPGGVSLSATVIATPYAGTLGGRIFDKTTGAKMLISNNHVIASIDTVQHP